VTPSLTNAPLGLAVSNAIREFHVLFNGELIALSLTATEQMTGDGSAIFEVTLNGVKLALPRLTYIFSTNPLLDSAIDAHNTGLSVPIAYNDKLQVVVTTNADFAPTPNTYTATLWCTVGSHAPG